MKDPIVEEIRSFRQEHTQQFHGDLTAICENLREIQRACGHTVVSFAPGRLRQPDRMLRNNERAEEFAA